jgi:hypothetical protein
MSAGNNPAFLTAKRLWRALGPGREFTCPARQAQVVGCDPLLDAIDDVRQSVVRGDSAYVHLLGGQGFLTTRLSEDGRTLTYKLADREPEPDTRSFMEIEQEQIDRVRAMQQRMMDDEWANRKRAQDMLDAPRLAAERAAFAWQLHEAGLDPQKVEARLVAIEAAIQRIERRLGAQDNDNDNDNVNNDDDNGAPSRGAGRAVTHEQEQGI